jgi:hypothetical protein
MSALVDELQVQLLAWERELDSRDGVIIASEDGLATSESAFTRACLERDTERT